MVGRYVQLQLTNCTFATGEFTENTVARAVVLLIVLPVNEQLPLTVINPPVIRVPALNCNGLFSVAPLDNVTVQGSNVVLDMVAIPTIVRVQSLSFEPEIVDEPPIVIVQLVKVQLVNEAFPAIVIIQLVNVALFHAILDPPRLPTTVRLEKLVLVIVAVPVNRNLISAP